jgi:hypothetical protein
MTSSPKTKAKRRIMWSVAFLLGLGIVIAISNDRSVIGLSVVIAAILGVPFLFLSLIDLGKALRDESGGNFRATKSTWLLAQLQAVFGAVCMAAAAFTLYQNIPAWFASPLGFHGVLLAVWIFSAVLLVVVGFFYIYSAFAHPRRGQSGEGDV